ncbi:MAG: hypothetical protein KAX31_03445 [Thermoplasmata archaeon]|nr:hypothetical protein [Thermoplasmata archaeon]
MKRKLDALERAKKFFEEGKVVIPSRMPVIGEFHPKSDAYLALKEAIG